MRKYMWDVTRRMIKSIRVDFRNHMGIGNELRMQVISPIVESSERQAKTFYSTDQEVALKFPEQSNADLAEMDRMYLEERRKLMVMGQIILTKAEDNK